MNLYLLPSFVVALFGLGAAFSWLSNDHKDVLLGSDSNGLEPLGLGIVLLVAGFFIPDYTGAYLLKGLGTLFIAFGALIMVDDSITLMVLSPLSGVFYALIAILAYVMGADATGGMVYNLHALFTLVLPVMLMTILITLALLTISSAKFKGRLSQSMGGGFLVIYGLVALALSPFAALNPALMIVTAGLGALLLTLGGLIVIDDSSVEKILGSQFAALMMTLLSVLCLIAARLLY